MKRHVAWGVVALLCLAVQSAAAADTRVRSVEPDVAQLLRDGRQKSPGLERLIRTIDDSDLLVYLFFRWMSLSTVGGYLEVVGAANGQRVVFIFINPALSPAHATAMIAHELQHAVEIANAPEVVDHASLVRHYERIGMRTRLGLLSESYDTAAARAIEHLVLDELLENDGVDLGDVTAGT